MMPVLTLFESAARPRNCPAQMAEMNLHQINDEITTRPRWRAWPVITCALTVTAIVGLTLLSTRSIKSGSLLRRSSSSSSSAIHNNDLVCNVVLNDMLHAHDENGTMAQSEEFFACHPVQNGFISGLMYLFDDELPAAIADTIRPLLRNGQAQFVAIPDGSLTIDAVVVPHPNTVRIIDSPVHQRHLATAPNLQGVNRLQVIRVTTTDSEPSYSAADIYHYLFNDDEGMRAQMLHCSNGLLTIESTARGVMDISVNLPASGMRYPAVMNAAETKANQLLGYTLRNTVDLVMFVIPPGTGNWAAFATVAGKQSVFNNRWGAYLGAHMHEFGHNLGLKHAWQNDVEYAAQTGYMGDAPQETNAPQSCYNGENHWMLNWYANHEITYSSYDPQLFKIAAFVDYDVMGWDEYAIVRAGNFYMQYNRATKHNRQTLQFPDRLTIDRPRSLGDGTDLLAGMSPSYGAMDFDNNSDGTLTIQVCQRVYADSSNLADYLIVSLSYNGESACGDTPNPTQKPSASPTGKPTTRPSSYPSLSPSDLPTQVPSEMPSTVPTPVPTISWMPSPLPSLAPTKSQMPTLSMEPSASTAIESQRLSDQARRGIVTIIAFLACLVVFVSTMLLHRRQKEGAEKKASKAIEHEGDFMDRMFGGRRPRLDSKTLGDSTLPVDECFPDESSTLGGDPESPVVPAAYIRASLSHDDDEMSQVAPTTTAKVLDLPALALSSLTGFFAALRGESRSTQEDDDEAKPTVLELSSDATVLTADTQSLQKSSPPCSPARSCDLSVYMDDDCCHKTPPRLLIAPSSPSSTRKSPHPPATTSPRSPAAASSLPRTSPTHSPRSPPASVLKKEPRYSPSRILAAVFQPAAKPSIAPAKVPSFEDSDHDVEDPNSLHIQSVESSLNGDEVTEANVTTISDDSNSSRRSLKDAFKQLRCKPPAIDDEADAAAAVATKRASSRTAAVDDAALNYGVASPTRLPLRRYHSSSSAEGRSTPERVQLTDTTTSLPINNSSSSNSSSSSGDSSSATHALSDGSDGSRRSLGQALRQLRCKPAAIDEESEAAASTMATAAAAPLPAPSSLRLGLRRSSGGLAAVDDADLDYGVASPSHCASKRRFHSTNKPEYFL